MSGPIVALLGPRAAGKSSVGRQLAARLGWPQHSVDAHCWAHYRELPEVLAAEDELRRRAIAVEELARRAYLDALAAVVGETHGEVHWWRLWERMRVHAALRCLEREGPAVVDFGAGHARTQLASTRAALRDGLARCEVAVWLQPWPEAERAAASLAERLRCLGRPVDERTLRGDCSPEARPRGVEVVYTGELDPGAVADRLTARVQGSV